MLNSGQLPPNFHRQNTGPDSRFVGGVQWGLRVKGIAQVVCVKEEEVIHSKSGCLQTGIFVRKKISEELKRGTPKSKKGRGKQGAIV